MIKLICCGSREWRDKDGIRRVLTTLRDNLGTFTIIEGENGKDGPDGLCWIGADRMCRDVGRELSLPVKGYPYLSQHGRAGGPLRNTQMLKLENPDGVVAFHYNIVGSRGTRNMVNQAYEASVPVWLWMEGATALFEFIYEMKKIQRGREN